MIRTRISLDTRRTDEGSPAPLVFVITKNSVRAVIPLGMSVQSNQWNKKWQRIYNHPREQALNASLEERRREIDDILFRLRTAGELDGLSSAQIRKKIVAKMYVDKKSEPITFLSRLESFMNRKTVGTKRIYESTKTHLEKWLGEDLQKLTFEQITPIWLRRFDEHLAHKSLSRNTRNIHFRNIRAVFNDAINEELISYYPFRKHKIVPEKTRKRALTIEQLRELFDTELTQSEERYRDCFKLIFMLCGINIIDLCNLDTESNGRVEYRRAKTHRLYSVKVEPEAEKIINKYKGTLHLLNYIDNCKDYRFFYRHLSEFLRAYGEGHQIKGLSTYWARHSWATIAASLDIPKETIAAALGHGGNTVTDIHIDFDQRKVDEANRKVLDWVLYEKK